MSNTRTFGTRNGRKVVAIQITCINKAGGQHYDPHTAIATLGWKNDATGVTGKSERLQVYDWLKQSSANQAYVADRLGNRAYLYPRENSDGTKFVQTVTERVWTDNLLALPECVG
jgi:hypothetical protein